MKIAVYGRNIPKSIDNYLSILNVLKSNDCKPFLYYEFAKFLSENLSDFRDYSTFSEEDYLTSDFAFFVSLGGDGTFLEATRFIRKNNIPVIGVNTGSLGFLANVSVDEFSNVLDEILNKKYEIEHRTLIHVTSQDEKNISICALNEITLQRTMSTLISSTVEINGERLSQYWSDGLIIATPTGSTAYSMSVGGPIIVPTASNFVISPIAPHNLSIRPFVISDDIEIKIKLQTRGEKAMLTADNEMFEVESGMEFTVKKSKYKISIIKPNSVNFYKTLRNKLMWGYDIRNDINVYQHSNNGRT
ncbi:MAG: NAD kinase [Prevotellaceae bacterium]|jgi:NAD+ kinase|nr:NAD kinase [Prevotellaceae bacterium]